MNAVRNKMARGVAAGDGQRCRGNVGGEDRSSGEVFGQGDGDAAGAGADVGDLQTFTGDGLFAAGAMFADGG